MTNKISRKFFFFFFGVAHFLLSNVGSKDVRVSAWQVEIGRKDINNAWAPHLPFLQSTPGHDDTANTPLSNIYL